MKEPVRKGERKDIQQVYKLIVELAKYENAADEVVTTVEELEADGFGPNKVFDFYVAEVDGIIVGFALYYISYSTWKGKCLYLEDFLVTECARGKGIGKKLFDTIVEEAKKMRVKRMDWQVLDWNQPAIEFYKKCNATLDSEWINGRLFFNS